MTCVGNHMDESVICIGNHMDELDECGLYKYSHV